MPKRASIVDVEWDLLMANGRCAEAARSLPDAPEREPGDEFRRRLQSMVAADETADLDAIMARRKIALVKRYGDEGATIDDRLSHGTLAYLKHDEAAFADAIDIAAIESLRLPAALCRRDVDAAEKAVAGEAMLEPTTSLLIYLAADLKGDRAAAERWLKRAIDDLRGGSAANATVATWLAGDRVPDEGDVLRWSSSPGEKAIILASLVTARPAARNVAAPLFERFAYNKTYPHELLAAAVAAHR